MRINKYVAQATGLSRRAADAAIEAGRVMVNGEKPSAGYQVLATDSVLLDGVGLNTQNSPPTTVLLNKPADYVCSRDGQGSKTVYDLLPPALHHLKSVGRLDKDSSGLLLMTNDGQLAYELTHPKFEKLKVYKIALNKDLASDDLDKITHQGIKLEDGLSKLNLTIINNQAKEWKVVMKEGRNRQIRRTFEALGYQVVKLHRTHFGPYKLLGLDPGKYKHL